MVMLSKIANTNLLTKYFLKPIPRCFDSDDLLSIERLTPLVWYDEMHVKQEGGARTWDNRQIWFPRDSSGKYNPSSHIIVDEDFRAAYKYAGEARFYFGCVKVQ